MEERNQKREADFEYEKSLTPTQRFEMGLRLHQRVREMNQIVERTRATQ